MKRTFLFLTRTTHHSYPFRFEFKYHLGLFLNAMSTNSLIVVSLLWLLMLVFSNYCIQEGDDYLFSVFWEEEQKSALSLLDKCSAFRRSCRLVWYEDHYFKIPSASWEAAAVVSATVPVALRCRIDDVVTWFSKHSCLQYMRREMIDNDFVPSSSWKQVLFLLALQLRTLSTVVFNSITPQPSTKQQSSPSIGMHGCGAEGWNLKRGRL